MADLSETYRIEQAKWNEVARRKLARLKPSKYANFREYARNVSTMVGVDDFLGDLEGKQVLEVGCGMGEISCLLALNSAHVTAFDISYQSVFVASKRAEMYDVASNTRFFVAAGESLPLPDGTFDVLFGKGILHHLLAASSQPELFRLLRHGGKAVFVEPLGMNPLLVFARKHLPYPNKNPRGADRPLNYNDIRDWSAGFSHVSVREIQLLSMLERAVGQGKRLPPLRKADDLLLRLIPFLRRFCRYAVLQLEKG